MIDTGQWREFGQDTGVTPYTLYEKCHGILNDHREEWLSLDTINIDIFTIFTMAEI